MKLLVSFQCSQIAAAIGHNPYKKSSEIIESLWRKHARESFTRAFSHAVTPAVRQNVHQAMSLIPQATQLCQAGVISGGSSKTIENVQKKTEELIGGAEETIKKAQQELEDLKMSAGKGDEKSKSALPDAQKKVHNISAAVEIVKKEIERSVNTTFGTARESDAISLFEKDTGLTVNRDRSIRRQIYNQENNPFAIVGAVDGLLGDDCVIEVKNRTKRLFRMIPNYEKVQIQAYMQLFQRNKAILLECLATSGVTKLNRIEQERDDEYWSVVLNRLEKFSELLSNLISEQEIAVSYATMNAAEREALILKYISEIPTVYSTSI